jgi:hypothetical protein
MAKTKPMISKFIEMVDHVMSSWVVRPALLLLGLWEFPSQPNVR